ncbi:hypothetical protein FF38_02336 [Lucilia cuprina]|uniref:FUN14 domain-containing protein 1 n=1 Tax=Lucilia cuprina TaxID=7375 RepID=A0A0L0C465_LUCCU|nr:hypothetical protein FF38_02336 [Lucilia cuprina]
MEENVANIFNLISSLSPYYQIGVGATSGWLTGFILMKIGKFAAILLGSAIILIKIAENERFIDIDWLKVKQNVENFSIKSPNNLTLGNTEGNVENFADPIEIF